MSRNRPELSELPALSRKDVAEVGAIAAARKALPSINQIGYASIAPTPEAVQQRETNAALKVAYAGDRARLQRDNKIRRFEERQLSNALANRDRMAARNMRKRGARREKFAGQRLKNFARSFGMGPELFRVLQT